MKIERSSMQSRTATVLYSETESGIYGTNSYEGVDGGWSSIMHAQQRLCLLELRWPEPARPTLLGDSPDSARSA